MKDVRAAFHGFWSGFGVPAYLSSFVLTRDSTGRPSAPSFPYITYEAVLPAFLGDTLVSASVWDRNPANPGYLGLIDGVLELMREAIPEGGALLDVGTGGRLWLFRSNPFMDYMSDPEDASIARGIVRCVARSYA